MIYLIKAFLSLLLKKIWIFFLTIKIWRKIKKKIEKLTITYNKNWWKNLNWINLKVRGLKWILVKHRGWVLHSIQNKNKKEWGHVCGYTMKIERRRVDTSVEDKKSRRKKENKKEKEKENAFGLGYIHFKSQRFW